MFHLLEMIISCQPNNSFLSSCKSFLEINIVGLAISDDVEGLRMIIRVYLSIQFTENTSKTLFIIYAKEFRFIM